MTNEDFDRAVSKANHAAPGKNDDTDPSPLFSIILGALVLLVIVVLALTIFIVASAPG